MNIYILSIYSIEQIDKPKLLMELPIKADNKADANEIGHNIAFEKYEDVKRMISTRKE